MDYELKDLDLNLDLTAFQCIVIALSTNQHYKEFFLRDMNRHSHCEFEHYVKDVPFKSELLKYKVSGFFQKYDLSSFEITDNHALPVNTKTWPTNGQSKDKVDQCLEGIEVEKDKEDRSYHVVHDFNPFLVANSRLKFVFYKWAHSWAEIFLQVTGTPVTSTSTITLSSILEPLNPNIVINVGHIIIFEFKPKIDYDKMFVVEMESKSLTRDMTSAASWIFRHKFYKLKKYFLLALPGLVDQIKIKAFQSIRLRYDRMLLDFLLSETFVKIIEDEEKTVYKCTKYIRAGEYQFYKFIRFTNLKFTLNYFDIDGETNCKVDLFPWNSASTFCESKGGYLPQLTSAKEQDELFILKTFSGWYMERVYIGLKER